MAWTPDGIFVDEFGNPTYPGPEAYGEVPPEAQPASSPVAGSEPLPVAPVIPTLPQQPVVPAMAPLAPGQATGVSTGAGYSVSGTPVVDRKAFQSGWEGDKAFRAAQEAEMQAQIMAPIDANLAERESRIMSPEDLKHAPSVYDAENEKILAGAEQSQRMSALYRDFAAQETAAQAAAQGMIQKASAQYQSQIQQYQAMRVNPGQLWGDMTGGQRAGTFASVFIHDFLGAKGVHTSVMDTINMAVDRNMQAQSANIAKQGQVAGMFKDLYNMTVSESASQEETRARMRGFYLAQMENDVASELARYDAPLAQAKAAEAISILRDARNKTAMEVQKFVSTRVDNLLQMDLSARNAALQAAATKYASDAQLRVTNREAELKAMQTAAPGVPPDMLPYAIFDPETHDLIGFDTSGKPELTRRTAEFLEGHKMATDVAGKIIDWTNTHKAIYNGPLGTLYQDADEAHIRGMWNSFISAETKRLSGLAATDMERKFIEQQFPLKTFLRDPAKAMAAWMTTSRANYETMMGTRVVKPEKLIQGYSGQGANYTVGGTEAGLPSTDARSNEGDMVLEGVKPSDPVAEKFHLATDTTHDLKERGIDAYIAATQVTEMADPVAIIRAIEMVDTMSGEDIQTKEAFGRARTHLRDEYKRLTGEDAPDNRPEQPGIDSAMAEFNYANRGTAEPEVITEYDPSNPVASPGWENTP